MKKLIVHTEIKDIKDYLYEICSIEVVIIQIGGWFETIEESADIINSEFNTKIHSGGRSHRVARFPIGGIDKYNDHLDMSKFSYCFILETDRSEQQVSRKVEISSNKEILGIEFVHKIKD
jgi:hypothetical protein